MGASMNTAMLRDKVCWSCYHGDLSGPTVFQEMSAMQMRRELKCIYKLNYYVDRIPEKGLPDNDRIDALPELKQYWTCRYISSKMQWCHVYYACKHCYAHNPELVDKYMDPCPDGVKEVFGKRFL